MKKIDKCFNVCASVICTIYALIGIAITIAAWCMPTFFIEIRIAISIFGLGFLFTISVMILYLIWSKK